MKIERARIWQVLFVGIALAALVLLAAGVSGLQFAPGLPFSPPENAPPGRELDTGEGWDRAANYVRIGSEVAFYFLLAVLPVAILYYLLTRAGRRDLIQRLIAYSLLILFFLLLSRGSTVQPPQPVQPIAPAQAAGGPAVALDVQPPHWLFPFMKVGLVILLAALIGGGLWLVLSRVTRPKTPLRKLAGEAQIAIDALQSGADLRNTVLRCYFEMSRIIGQERGITREDAMTPREFERRLVAVGLPEQPVWQLTRLFEGARYGAREAGTAEEQQAITCLTVIAEACRRGL